MSLNIGFLIFPRMTQLDFTGPFEVLSLIPNATVHVAAKSLEPVESNTGLRILPTTDLNSCPQLDVLVVPGGPHVDEWFDDQAIMSFLKTQSKKTKYVTSVCTGALILGAAGLLDGYEATTHWTSLEYLKQFGAIANPSRVVIDRDRMTGGGVTAGIDFALTLVAKLVNEETAKALQLGLEYNPAPPFNSGHPSVADPKLVQIVTDSMKERLEQRAEKSESVEIKS